MEITGWPFHKTESRLGFAMQQPLCCTRLVEITLVILGLFVACSATADGLSQYKDFVSNPPWIKKMTFAQSGNLYFSQIRTNAPIPTPGFVLFNAAIQPDSYYLEFVTNAPGGEKSPVAGNGYVVGKSFQDYWSVTADRKTFSLCPVKASGNSSLKSVINVPLDTKGRKIKAEVGGDCPLKGVAGIFFNTIREVQKLGLVYLEPNKVPDAPQTIDWLDELNFKAETAQHGTMRGKIVGLTNGFPAKVEFEFAKIHGTTYTVIYGYETKRQFPPFSVTAYKTTGTNTEQQWKFLLPDIETGISDAGLNGFSPENFMSSNQMAMATKFIQSKGGKLTMISSNGVTTNVTLANYNILKAGLLASKGEIITVRIIMWSFVAVSFAVLFWAAKKTIKK